MCVAPRSGFREVADRLRGVRYPRDGSGGGSWSFDPEEIRAVIGEWKVLLEELEADRAQINSIVDALAVVPSEDTPTLGYVRALSDGVAGLEDSNFSMNEYVAEFVRKLEDAKKAISSTDQSGSETFGSGEVETV